MMSEHGFGHESRAGTSLDSAGSRPTLLPGCCCLASQTQLLLHVGSPLAAQMRSYGV